jgi:hypothetical protein
MELFEQLLQHPYSMVVAGPSKAGKTVFVSKLLEHIGSLSTEAPSEIIWCYSDYQSNYQALLRNIPHMRLVQGLPSIDELRKETRHPRLLILDDLMAEMGKDKQISNLFTRGVHHWGVSVIAIVQNIFHGGLRTARINAHYLALFKSPGDKLQITTLARQLYPRKSGTFIDAYHDATSEAYSYLFVDLSQSCPEELRLRTNIFPGELTIIYT